MTCQVMSAGVLWNEPQLQGGTPPGVFGCVANKGVAGAFFRMCGKERTYGRKWARTRVFVGLEGRIPATVAQLGTGPHGGIVGLCEEVSI